MHSLSRETYYPRDQYQLKAEAAAIPENQRDFEKHFELKPGAKGYEIQPLNSLQFTEVMSNGLDASGTKVNFTGIMLLLRYGLVNQSDINAMGSVHHIEVAQQIRTKAALAEAERKN